MSPNDLVPENPAAYSDLQSGKRMRQYHRNIFFYYRGPSATRGGGGYDRQLEDNTTKALINVLDLADREHVLRPFLQRFCRVRCRQSASVEFALQRPDIHQPGVSQRVALVIAPSRGWAAAGAHHDHGRPDAWIWQTGTFAVLIENKVVGQATMQQVRRHIRGARGWTHNNCTIEPVTWAAVHDFFRELIRTARHWSPRTDFLVRQFEEYLRMTNLSASTVLETEDFMYFATPEEDRHPVRKAAVERKFCDLAEQIAAQPIMRRAMRLYGGKSGRREGTVNPGRFGRDRADFWISIGPRNRGTNAHFTVRIEQEGVSIDCFSPHRPYTRRIIRAIRDYPGDFIKALGRIPRSDGFAIRLREAYYADPKSSYKGRRIGKIRDFLEVHPRELTKENLQPLVLGPLTARIDARNLRPELSFVRYFALREVVGTKDVVNLVAEAAEKMLPFLKFALHHAGDPK